jgi:hypothetical protein
MDGRHGPTESVHAVVADLLVSCSHNSKASYPFQFLSAAKGLAEGSAAGGLSRGSTWAQASASENAEPLGSLPPAASL